MVNKKVLKTDDVLKQQMVDESLLILKTVDWAEKEILGKIEALEFARENYLISEEEDKEREIKELLGMLDAEIGEMDAFMGKYEKIIKESQNEIKKSKA